MLRNWLLGVFATGLWIADYLLYFRRDIVAWRRAHRDRRRPPLPLPFWHPHLRKSSQTGLLLPFQRRPFPPPEPPPRPVRDADVTSAPSSAKRD